MHAHIVCMQAGEDRRDFPILPSAALALDSTDCLNATSIIRALLSGEMSRAQGRGKNAEEEKKNG